MKTFNFRTRRKSSRLLASGLSLVIAIASLVSGAILAQTDLSIEDLERLIEERRLTLQETIAERESAAARIAEIREALAESESRKDRVETEIEALCQQQEALQAGTLESCLSQLEN